MLSDNIELLFLSVIVGCTCVIYLSFFWWFAQTFLLRKQNDIIEGLYKYNFFKAMIHGLVSESITSIDDVLDIHEGIYGSFDSAILNLNLKKFLEMLISKQFCEKLQEKSGVHNYSGLLMFQRFFSMYVTKPPLSIRQDIPQISNDVLQNDDNIRKWKEKVRQFINANKVYEEPSNLFGLPVLERSIIKDIHILLKHQDVDS